ncbi:hypothetical protein LZ575_03310 [Antarcticibacterium sp. 1MA-6-2]|uniref:hypothetical protein n=1 Tax=Antarcticibacterium sp. 1MA-6-2 TaxID=2908210 RepID=UPI001F199669|nr:hypothetical protein [Antarcticibacterium sp. 1MA-6-2]UJH91725.1 hypothetical protein LZ575_03310 [Antarcticibacterium sp. 1MA-6-2]
MKKISLLFYAFVVLFLSAGCGAGNSTFSEISRAPEDVPDAFVLQEGVVFDENSCKSPLIDPRDGTQLMIIRSSNSIGDYLGPEGKYGLRRKELLRINCKTGEVIGIVKR